MFIHGHAITHRPILLLLGIYIVPGFAIKNYIAVAIVAYYFSQILASGFCKNSYIFGRHYSVSN